MSHETQFGLNASLYNDFTNAEQIVAKDEDLTVNLKALFQNMINHKLSFASKSDFLHHSFERYMANADVSLVWKFIDIVEVIAISILAFITLQLHIRTSTLSETSKKGPITALLTAATPTTVKAMAHDFEFITYEHQTQKTSPVATVQWYHTMFLTFGICLLCSDFLYLLYKCCMRKCYHSQTLYQPDLIQISHPRCKLKLILQTQSIRASVFVSKYPYDAKDLTFESLPGSIFIRPHFTLRTSELIILWHGASLFLDSLVNTLGLPSCSRISRYHRNIIQDILQCDSISVYVMISDERNSYRTPLQLSPVRSQFTHSTPLSQSQDLSFPHVRFSNNTAIAMLCLAQDLYRTTFSINDSNDTDDSPQPHSSHMQPKRKMRSTSHQIPLTQPLIQADSSDDSPPTIPKKSIKGKKVTFGAEPMQRRLTLGCELSDSLHSLASYSYETADETFGAENNKSLTEQGEMSSIPTYMNMSELDAVEESIEEVEESENDF